VWYIGRMKILFVADGRSPIALNWLRYFVERGDEVFLASTFTCNPDLKLNGLDIVPVAFSGVKSAPIVSAQPRGGFWGASSLRLRTVIRHWFGPLTIPRAAGRLREVIERVQPDLIHAMRIPYEGMLAADAVTAKVEVPLLVSVWGNDFTLHAPSTWQMRHYTEWTMKVADALHADCQRDIRLAKKWGFQQGKPTLVIPGSGGIRSDVFFPPSTPVDSPVVLNPRGFRAYVRNDTFFQAIPLVLKHRPDARFVCASMAAENQALDWIAKLGIESSVVLLPPRPHNQMAELFRSAQVVVSPSIHDGTPNSLLEGMACGCFPVAGNLDSIREWITSGKNGLLVDADNPLALAEALLRGLNEPAMRKQAADENAAIIAERAEYTRGMARALEFYEKLTK
jgi:glycosyltransferase involved in cell wall biosynthesis